MRHNFSSNNSRISIGSQSSKEVNELAVLLEYIDKFVADIDIERKRYNRFYWGTSILEPNLQNTKFNLQNISLLTRPNLLVSFSVTMKVLLRMWPR